MEEFDELYRLYNKKIYSYLLYLTKDINLAEELLQETFFQAFKNIDKFKGKSLISTWIFGISRNVYYTWLRDKRKREYISVDQISEELNSNDNNIQRIVQDEELRELFDTIDKLEEPYREVILLRGVNKLSYKEISEIMNRKESWVRVIFHRGKIKLKDLILEKEERYNE